jgi:hypothetical protein
MSTIERYGCVLAVVSVFGICTQGQSQRGSSQRATRTPESTASAPAPIEATGTADESTATKLPVRRVVLYKTGVPRLAFHNDTFSASTCACTTAYWKETHSPAKG